MGTESKAEQLITKLIRETTSGSVSWSIRSTPFGLDHGTEDIIPLYLETNYKGQRIGVYLRRYKSFVDEYDFHWSEDIGFCLTDGEGRVVWEYEERSPTLVDLFSTAREQASGIGDLLDDLLGE